MLVSQSRQHRIVGLPAQFKFIIRIPQQLVVAICGVLEFAL
jgi:hypothetical protein